MSSEDEAVASDLDMHSLILSGLNQDTEPVKTADEIIREIDDMMEVCYQTLLSRSQYVIQCSMRTLSQ